MIRSLKGRIHFAHVRNLHHFEPGVFEEAAHLSSDGSFDLYEMVRALYETGFDGPIRPDHGRAIWGEVSMPGYGLYDKSLSESFGCRVNCVYNYHFDMFGRNNCTEEIFTMVCSAKGFNLFSQIGSIVSTIQ